MKTDKRQQNPRDRILAVASELFFEQGYQATGVNEVIAKSGVAKATFYHHFPSKEDLCLEYLQSCNTNEYEAAVSSVRERSTARERFLAVIESTGPWLEANALRGCAFLNIVAEVPDPLSRLRREGQEHYERLRALVRRLARELIDSDPQRYGHLDPGTLAGDYIVVLGGAIAMSEIYHDLWPVKQGEEMVKRMIG